MRATITLESSPMSNQMMNSGASAMRGMLFTAAMYGSITFAMIFGRENSSPTATLNVLPQGHREVERIGHHQDARLDLSAGGTRS